MMLQTDSDRTSVSSNRAVPFIQTQRELIAAEIQVEQVIIAHPDAQPSDVSVGGSEVSAKRKPFNTNIVISSPSQISVIDAKWDANEYFVFGIEASTSVPRVVQDQPRGSVLSLTHLSKTIETWTIASTFEAEFNESLSELRSIVSAIRLGATQQCSPQFEELLGRALAARGTPADIDQWARRLAEDVRDLDD